MQVLPLNTEARAAVYKDLRHYRSRPYIGSLFSDSCRSGACRFRDDFLFRDIFYVRNSCKRCGVEKKAEVMLKKGSK